MDYSNETSTFRLTSTHKKNLHKYVTGTDITQFRLMFAYLKFNGAFQIAVLLLYHFLCGLLRSEIIGQFPDGRNNRVKTTNLLKKNYSAFGVLIFYYTSYITRRNVISQQQQYVMK